MSEAFLLLFDEAYRTQQEQLRKFEYMRTIANPDMKQEYTLTHRYLSAPNTFLCKDSSNNKLHFKVLPCKSYSELKKGMNLITKINSLCQSNAFLESLDSFEILDQDRWYLTIVTPSQESVTLWHLAQAVHKLNLRLSKDQSISILLAMIEAIEDTYNVKKSLGFVYPNNVIICKSSLGLPLFSIGDTTFSLKLSPFSRHTFASEETELQNFYLDNDDDLWGISLSLYSIIGTKSLVELPQLKTFNFEEIKKLTEIIFEDPALERVFRMLQKGDESIFKHPFINIWKGFCQKNLKLIEDSTVSDLEVMYSGLLFSDPAVRQLVVKQLLTIESDFKVYTKLNENDIFLVFIEECLKIEWRDCTKLLEVFLKMLTQKPKDSIFKEKLGELGIIELVFTIIELDPHNQAFYEFIKNYMSENTLTLMQVLYDSGVTIKTLDLAKKSQADKLFLLDTMSYYGPHSPKLIEKVFSLEIFPDFRIIQALIDIPYYHKLEKLDQVLELTVSILNKRTKEDHAEVIKYTIELITEVLCLPYYVQSNHFKGICSSHIEQEIFSLSKNPFLYYCIDCTDPLCSACWQHGMHKSHKTCNLLYITPHFRCNCSDTHELPELNIKAFTSPKYVTRFNFLPSTGDNMAESYINKFTSKSDMYITTIEPLVSDWSQMGNETIAYYEVKINKAGKYEKIIIGFLGAEVQYHGVNGNIYVDNKVVLKAPRFGSYDIIGLGLLRNGKVFFTYNGLLSSSMIDCDANQEIKLYVSLGGDGCEVEIKLRNFLFQSSKFGIESFSSKSKELVEDIFNKLTKDLKKGKESKIGESKIKFRDLLKKIGREDLLKKLGKFKLAS